MLESFCMPLIDGSQLVQVVCVEYIHGQIISNQSASNVKSTEQFEWVLTCLSSSMHTTYVVEHIHLITKQSSFQSISINYISLYNRADKNAASSCNYCAHTNTHTHMVYTNANPFENLNNVYLTCENNMHCATIDERIRQLMPSSSVISEHWRCDTNVLRHMYWGWCVELHILILYDTRIVDECNHINLVLYTRTYRLLIIASPDNKIDAYSNWET